MLKIHLKALSGESLAAELLIGCSIDRTRLADMIEYRFEITCTHTWWSRKIFKSNERYLQGSPYEQIRPVSDTGPWKKLALRHPGFFDPIAMEYLIWGWTPNKETNKISDK